MGDIFRARVTTKAAWLTVPMRDFLMDHVDRAAPIDRAHGKRKPRTMFAAINRGLVCWHPEPRFPTHTKLTDAGRNLLCAVLAEYADILSAAEDAGFVWAPPLKPESPEPEKATETAVS